MYDDQDDAGYEGAVRYRIYTVNERDHEDIEDWCEFGADDLAEGLVLDAPPRGRLLLICDNWDPDRVKAELARRPELRLKGA